MQCQTDEAEYLLHCHEPTRIERRAASKRPVASVPLQTLVVEEALGIEGKCVAAPDSGVLVELTVRDHDFVASAQDVFANERVGGDVAHADGAGIQAKYFS